MQSSLVRSIKYFFMSMLLLGLGSRSIYGQTPLPWELKETQELTHYKVEVFERRSMGKFPIVEAMRLRIVPKAGGSVTEYVGKWLDIDPRKFVKNWQAGQKLDINGNGVEELWVQDFSGGAHCCYQYVVFELSQPLKRLGKLKLRDCGEQIEFKDLVPGEKLGGLPDTKPDGKPELLTCDARFTYLGKNPFAGSPFPPAIYAWRDEELKRVDQEFPQIFQKDLKAQRELFKMQKNEDINSAATILQIVLDHLFLGETKQAWEFFDQNYTKEDKEEVRSQLKERLGLDKQVLQKESPLQNNDSVKEGQK